jgi:hypothetical protein
MKRALEATLVASVVVLLLPISSLAAEFYRLGLDWSASCREWTPRSLSDRVELI